MKFVAVNRFDGTTEPISEVEVFKAIGKENYEDLLANGTPKLSDSKQEVYVKLLIG